MIKKKNEIFFGSRAVRWTIFLLFSVTALPAQLLLTHPSEPAAGDLVFNAELLKLAKVKSITLHISEKPDLQVINDQGLVQCYEFDSTGHVKRYYTTSIVSREMVETPVKAVYYRGRRIRPAYVDISWKYVYDTSFTWFAYNKQNRLIMKRSNYGDIFNTYYYDYDSLGRVTKETNCRETNKNLSRQNFELGVQTILSTESFEYVVQSPTQLKKLCYNDDGKVYKQGIINRNSDTVTEDFSFVVGYVRYSNSYVFDKSGKLISRSSISNSNGDMKQSAAYEYDENGNVTVEKHWKNDTLTDELNYLYDDEKKLFRSRLDRDFLHLAIEIVKVTYDYFP